MGRRREARETALQILYELEFNEDGPEAVLLRRRKDRRSSAEAAEFTAWLVRGAAARRAEIDDLLQTVAKNWRVARMGLIDRNILRLGIYEMLEEKILAPAIIINEAVEIARRFSGDEAAVFVNGVLDAVRKAKFGNKEKAQDHERTKKDPPSPRRGSGDGPGPSGG